jgi:AcrR family transcriptional regulator
VARTVDAKLRDQILADCVDAALKSGIRKISLAQLSKITGVSRRMLIYHFGSVEQLIAETLSGAQQRLRDRLHKVWIKDSRLDSRQAILTLWNQSISPSMEESIRAYFNLYVEALEDRDGFRDFISYTVPGWISWTKAELSEHKPALSECDLTLILSILRGLLLDYWATRDRVRTTRALESFLAGHRFEQADSFVGQSIKREVDTHIQVPAF